MLYKALRYYKDDIIEYQKFFPDVNKLIALAKKATLFFQNKNPEIRNQIRQLQGNMQLLKAEIYKLQKSRDYTTTKERRQQKKDIQKKKKFRDK